MEALIPIIAILSVFGVPAYMYKRQMDFKERKLEIEASSNKQLEALNADREELLARVEALEAVVHDGDYELNRQLKLVAKEEAKRQLVAPAKPAE